MNVGTEHQGIGTAAYYQQFYSERVPGTYGWILAEIVKFGKAGNLLDLGCGIGLVVELASRWGMDAQGFDGSEDAVKMALIRNPALNLHCQRLSEPIELKDESVDNVLLNQVIEHLPEKVLKHILVESSRVLRPGGMIFLFSPSKADEAEIRLDPTHINPLYPSELRQCLLDAGFEIVAEPNCARFRRIGSAGRRMVSALMGTRLRDWLSATTNAYARKPVNP